MSRANPQPSKQTNFPSDVLIRLDRTQPRRLRSQLELELRGAIQDGRLASGAALPPSRLLAIDLGVSRSVVAGAYSQLAADGYLQARQGSGTRVRALLTEARASNSSPQAARSHATFLGGVPDPAFFPRREWARHYRAALDELPDAGLTYPGAQGAADLRSALASYLGRVRGVVGAPASIVITTGFTQALAVLARALAARGARAVAVEDPCFGLHRQVIAAAGLAPIPVPVDGDGLDVARLDGLDAAAVLVAPAHSYPRGAVLTPTRRAELLAWAERNDAVVIEDDYDAEFRYDGTPVGAMQGLAPERVAYCGCVSKTLSPALRLGWVAAPSWLVGDLRREKALADFGSGLLEQLALARFIDAGGFTRHLRRVRPRYAGRRAAALEAFAELMPAVRVDGVQAGLHAYACLPVDCDEQALVTAARRSGVVVEGAAWHWARPEHAPPAMVFGYASQSEASIRRGIATIALALRKDRGVSQDHR